MAVSVGDGGVVSLSKEQLSKPRQEKGRKTCHEAKQRDSGSNDKQQGPGSWAVMSRIHFV